MHWTNYAAMFYNASTYHLDDHYIMLSLLIQSFTHQVFDEAILIQCYVPSRYINVVLNLWCKRCEFFVSSTGKENNPLKCPYDGQVFSKLCRMWMCAHTVPNNNLEALMIISFSQLIFSSYKFEGKTKYFLARLHWYIISYSWVNLLFHDTGLDYVCNTPSFHCSQ
jgi:hypothetical protein